MVRPNWSEMLAPSSYFKGEHWDPLSFRDLSRALHLRRDGAAGVRTQGGPTGLSWWQRSLWCGSSLRCVTGSQRYVATWTAPGNDSHGDESIGRLSFFIRFISIIWCSWSQKVGITFWFSDYFPSSLWPLNSEVPSAQFLDFSVFYPHPFLLLLNLSSHSFKYHLYGNDSQVYIFKSSSISRFQTCWSSCLLESLGR